MVRRVPSVREFADRVLSPLIRFLHERLGWSPNQISTIGFIVGLIAAMVVAFGKIEMGLTIMALSQIIDGLDGGVARRYGLFTPLGARLEIIYDRLDELAILLALAYVGYVTYLLAALAFVAILLVTAVEPYSKFDPGFKRFMIYFGWLAGVLFSVNGFEIALNVIFFANLAVFAVGTVIVEYRVQKEIDAKAIAEREAIMSAGLPLPPEDPPSFLSRIASWF